MEFKSSVIEEYVDQLALSALPAYLPPQQSLEATPELAKHYPFILNTGSRLPMFVHTRTYRLPWTRSLRPHPAADLNPADARRLGIQQDDEIEIATTAGAIRVRANLTELAQPGVVHMYHGYSAADVNSLLEADYLDPLSGFPGFKALLCSVVKAEDGAPTGSASRGETGPASHAVSGPGIGAGLGTKEATR
jgi:anaerobic selenocysteine-containing dehydrogenase